MQDVADDSDQHRGYDDEDWNDEADNQAKLKEALRAVLRVSPRINISIFMSFLAFFSPIFL